MTAPFNHLLKSPTLEKHQSPDCSQHQLANIMGNHPSKRVSSTSTTSLLTTYHSSTSSQAPSTPPTPTYSDITSPASPKHLTRISEIIDPRELLNDEIYNVTPTRPRSSSQHLNQHHQVPVEKVKHPIVHSPSGNELDAAEFLRHPSRPLAMWERQERVVQATREGMERFEAESRLGNRSRMGSRLERRRDVKKRRLCCWLW